MDVGLKEYVEKLLHEHDRRYEQRFNLADIAIDKAEKSIRERLQGMNEFREALRDQSNQMATRKELELLAEIVNELRRSKSNLDGRLAVIAILISLVVSSFISYMIKK